MTAPSLRILLRCSKRLAGSVVALLAWQLWLTPVSAQNLTITNFTSYVGVHFISIPNKSHQLQGAWIYPTNVARVTYTNLLWTNLTTWPPLPTVNHIDYRDYSVTNRVPNRFRIYRVRTT